MLQRRTPGLDRAWFVDPRSPGRRMSISVHPAEGVVVVSLWHEDTCSGTFRLPLSDAPELISTLAYGMAANLAPDTEVGPTYQKRRVSQLWTWIKERMRQPPGSSSGLHLVR
jgi:hypothetical protein